MKIIFMICGWMSMALGVIGIALPLMPAVPFFILAAYFFSKCSPALHDWLLNHPVLGPQIISWRTHGAIHPKIKILACVMMSGSAVSLWMLGQRVPGWLRGCVVILLILICGFILSRPSYPKVKE